MRSINSGRRDLDRLSSRQLRKRTSLQVIVGAVAILAIALAFIFRPGQTTDSGKSAVPTSTAAPAAAQAKPAATATSAPVVAAATPMPATPASTGRTHEVGSGDTLSTIAQKYYSDASKWEKIYQANRDVLPSADALKIGQKLKIPD